MVRKLRNFLRLPRGRKLLLMETALRLVQAWWLVRRRPFRRYVSRLGQTRAGEYVDERNLDMPAQPLGEVRWALNRVNRLARGRFTCLMLAMAGKGLLNRRGLANTLVLGVDLNRGAETDPMAAHAWLRAGRFVVIGGEQRPGHIPVASYHSQPAQ